MVDVNSLETVADADLDQLQVRPSPVEQQEWAAPAQEDITGYKFSRRVHLESNSSQTNSIESPLAWVLLAFLDQSQCLMSESRDGFVFLTSAHLLSGGCAVNGFVS